MPTREPLIMGPFVGGLNTFDDPSAIADTEVQMALNFDTGTDGSFHSRPGIANLSKDLTLGSAGLAPRFLGWFTHTDGSQYMIASARTTTYYRTVSGNWTVLTSTFAANDMVQFDGKAWLVAPISSGSPGGYWTVAGGFVADTDMPKGESIASYKSRLFVAAGRSSTTPTRLYYSKVTGQPNFWTAAAFVEIGYGDGEAIVKIVNYSDSIVAFREHSIWAYEYSADPATASAAVVVPGVGLVNRFSLAVYENALYFLYNSQAYVFSGNRARSLSDRVAFTGTASTTTQPFSVSIWNDRLLVSYYENVYVYSLRTGIWTMWNSTAWGPLGQFMQVPSNSPYPEAYIFQSASLTGSGVAKTLWANEVISSLTPTSETMICSISTKIYSFQAPGVFKVLFWWGIDAFFNGTVRGYAIPVTYSQATSWGTLLSSTWGSLGTWSHPAIPDPTVLTSVTATGINTSPIRKFVKFLKKLRFRQIYFRVEFDTNGTYTNRISLFTISTYMARKQTVANQVS